jgi:hypothetical protein
MNSIICFPIVCKAHVECSLRDCLNYVGLRVDNNAHFCSLPVIL